MTWTLETLGSRPERLNLPMRPVVAGVSEKAARDSLTVGKHTYNVCFYSKGGVGADGVATLDEGAASLGVDCRGNSTGTKNAFLLPWADDTITISTLGPKHKYFFTAKLNGCGILIAGGLCNPTVAHCNAKDAIEPPKSLGPEGIKDMVGQYEGIYSSMGEKLAARGELDPANMQLFSPGMHDYIGDAAVFGVQNATKWAFYAVIGSSRKPPVHKIWPAD